MYWLILLVFIVTILIPDIVRGPIWGISETRVEEIAIFLAGTISFLIFLKFEQIVTYLRKEKEKDQKKINQAVKDLVESYSYIGEVNRKMDILMNIALGLSDRSILNKKSEKEIYESIIGAANFLMKAEHSSLRFVDMANGKTQKEIFLDDSRSNIKNADLTKINEDINVIKTGGCLVIASSQKINEIKGFIIIGGHDKEEEDNPKNIEILKVFVSQAIFLYSYVNHPNRENCPPCK